MSIIRFVMFMIHLHTCCIILCCSTTYSQCGIASKRKWIPGPGESVVLKGKSWEGGREKDALRYRGSGLSLYSRTVTALNETFWEKITQKIWHHFNTLKAFQERIFPSVAECSRSSTSDY